MCRQRALDIDTSFHGVHCPQSSNIGKCFPWPDARRVEWKKYTVPRCILLRSCEKASIELKEARIVQL